MSQASIELWRKFVREAARVRRAAAGRQLGHDRRLGESGEVNFSELGRVLKIELAAAGDSGGDPGGKHREGMSLRRALGAGERRR